jgi:phosphatidylserine/phosphatidylglycerophosphate/cardiolipin synthase-like enzyme
VTSRRLAVVALALALCGGGALVGTTAAVESGAPGTANATLTGAYPNPVADGDPGEFVTVRFPEPTNTTGWRLTDGTAAVRLPNRTVEGTVAFSVTPEAARPHAEPRVVGLGGEFQLANGGERLALEHDGSVVDTAVYRDAPESRVRNFTAGEWRPVGRTEFSPVETDGGAATAFVLPDAPEKTAALLADAEERLRVAGYTLTSERATDAIIEAHEAGATVRVLLDGNPVGGTSERQARQLDRLTDAGVAVRLLAGPHSRYRYHHPKYAVVDDRAVVLTENFKPAGTGGMSSRGWGVVLDDPAAVAALSELHAADWGWRAATPWERYRRGRDFVAPEPATGAFEPSHPPKRVDVESTTVLVAPDNAADALAARIEAADDRVLVQQVTVGSRDNRLLAAALRAADRGATVRVHLAGAWYVESENAEVVAWLNRRAEAEGWDLRARVDSPDGYEKIHTKGVVVDDTAFLGSLNWKRSSARRNREVVVGLESAAAADYYAGVFEGDFSESGARRPLPTGVVGGVAVAISGALLLARRIEFVGRDGVITDWRS